jgi:hypothetical protein
MPREQIERDDRPAFPVVIKIRPSPHTTLSGFWGHSVASKFFQPRVLRAEFLADLMKITYRTGEARNLPIQCMWRKASRPLEVTTVAAGPARLRGISAGVASGELRRHR